MPVSCSMCKNSYSTQFNLNKHLKRVHKMDKEPLISKHDSKFMCVECKVCFKFNNDLRKHLEAIHNFENIVEEWTFDDYNAFTCWLAQEQKTQNVEYVRNTGQKVTRNVLEKHYYECRRSYRKQNHISDINRKRKLKSQGYCKLESACVSQIILKRNTISDECFVQYFKSHYLHGEDLEHLRIPKEAKEVIQNKLSSGVPSKMIINESHQIKNDNPKRINLLKPIDIRNIKRKYKIFVKHDNENQTEEHNN